MLTVGIILAVLILIGSIRIGAQIEYSDEGISGAFTAGSIVVFRFPVNKDKSKAAEKKKVKRASKKKASKDEKKEKKSDGLTKKLGGNVQTVKKLLPLAVKSLDKLRQKLTINRLTLYYTVSCDDPYDTAMRYGELTAGLEVIRNMFTAAFKVKKWDVRTFFDFTDNEPRIYINAKLSIAIWQIISIALTAGGGLLKILRENNYGKAE